MFVLNGHILNCEHGDILVVIVGLLNLIDMVNRMDMIGFNLWK